MHSFIPPERFFSYLTWTDIQEMLDKENVVIIQPVRAIEQHGPHLPIIVDAAIGRSPAEGIATAVIGKLPFAWVTRDLSQSGVLGDATTATKEKGDWASPITC
jgi:creatinine amidohydrolase/Fe(II)-dependent formamide hydrolase-like protein